MFCLYNFSVKYIIKKIYLPPDGPLKEIEEAQGSHKSGIVRNFDSVSRKNVRVKYVRKKCES